MQYTIEVREITKPTSYDAQSLRTVVMAKDPDEAIHQYVRDRAAELMSFTHPGNGQESIATVKKEDSFFLVRVYET